MTPAGVQRLLLVALVAMASACGSGDATPPGDDPDAGDVDGGMGAGGLHLRFRATPEPSTSSLGGDFDCTLGDVSIHLEDLRFVNDATTSDDPRIRKDSVELSWEDGVDDGDDDGADDGGDATVVSDDESTNSVVFDDAPPGMYSSVKAKISAYSIAGTATLGETVHPTEIADEQASVTLTISLPDLMLGAGETLDIDIDLSLDDLVRAIDWDEVAAGDGGELLVGDGSSQIDDVLEDLQDAFDADVPDEE